MAKKTTTKKVGSTEKKVGSTKKTESNLFYVSADKVRRAEHLVANGAFKTLKAAYESLGGAFAEGHGYMPV